MSIKQKRPFIVSVAVMVFLFSGIMQVSSQTVTVDFSKTKQIIDGFGGSSAWSGKFSDAVMDLLYNNASNQLGEYDIIAAADLNKVTSAMLQDMRRQLRGRLRFKVLKNTLMRISMEQAGKEGHDAFMEQVAGPNVFMFTNGNPFKVAMELDANRVRVFAKAGDLALDNIVLSAGNTGLSPGPLIGKFGVLGVRTRIEGGNIWVVQDTTVCRAGEPINEDLVDLLQRMGVRASEMGLRVKAVYERGDIIPGDALILDLDDYRSRLEQAISEAFKVAVEAAYYTPATVPTILAKAFQQARSVALEAEWATRDTAELLIAKANSQARSLASMVGKKMAE